MKSRLSRFFVIVDTKYTGHALTGVCAFNCKSYRNVPKYYIQYGDYVSRFTDDSKIGYCIYSLRIVYLLKSPKTV